MGTTSRFIRYSSAKIVHAELGDVCHNIAFPKYLRRDMYDMDSVMLRGRELVDYTQSCSTASRGVVSKLQ